MREKFLMFVFILVLGTVLTGTLVVVNDYTTPIIAKNKRLNIKKTVLEVFKVPFAENNIEDVFSENINVLEAGNKKFYLTKNKEVAFEFSGPGLWGPIAGVMAFMPDMETISGIKIIHQEETPGLGGRIAEKEYLNKFAGKKFSPDLKILPPGKAAKENEIDGITGATMTVGAFEKLINAEVSKYRDMYSKLTIEH